VNTGVWTGAALAVAGFLAGCGSSGESGSFSGLLAQRDNQFEDIRGSAYFSPAALPVSGTARYQGFVFAGTANPATNTISNGMVGRLAIDANFGGDTINGAATDFVTENGDQLSGSLALGPTFINGFGQDAIATSMNGNLTGAGGDVYVVTSNINGNFFGATGNIIAGDVTGSYVRNGSLNQFDGDFQAVQ
jgi:hypothetical protein